MSAMEEATARGHNAGQPEIYPYPTVSPRVVVVPILSCIFGFPVLVMLVICGLRYRAQRARMRAKKNRGREEEGAEGMSDGREGRRGGRGIGPYISISQYEEDTGNFYQSTTMRALSLKGFGRGDGGLAVRFSAISETDLDTVVEERSDYDLSEMTSSEYIHTPADTPPHMITYI